MFPTPLKLLVDMYSCARGLFWRKCSWYVCDTLYFLQIKWSR